MAPLSWLWVVVGASMLSPLPFYRSRAGWSVPLLCYRNNHNKHQVPGTSLKRVIYCNFLRELRRMPKRRSSQNSYSETVRKGWRSLQCSLTDHRNDASRPILGSLHLPNPRPEGGSYPFSDSLLTAFYEVRR